MKARKPNIFLTSANTPEENAIATPAVAATSAASVTGIDESNSLKSSSAASLVTAIRQSQHAELEDLLRKAPDIDGRDERGDTPIMWASTCNDLPAVKLLLKAKADANIPNQYGNIPLAVAAYNGYSDVIPDLIVGGASVNQKGIDGRSPIWYAAEQRQEEAVLLLTQFGAKLSRRTKRFFKKECQLDADAVLRQYQQAAACIQSQIRRAICQRKLRNWQKSATKMQALHRGHIARLAEEAKHRAATKIQATLRGFKTRLWYTRLLLEREQKLMESKAATDEDDYDIM